MIPLGGGDAKTRCAKTGRTVAAPDSTAGRLQRSELAKGVSDLQRQMTSGEPTITPEKVGRIAVLLRDKLHSGPPELRQAYARLLMEEIRITDEEIRISGSKAVLARAASEDVAEAAPKVLSFVLSGLRHG